MGVMADKNVNFNRYFLSIIQDFDESTSLNPNLNDKKIPKFFEDHLEINNEDLQVFCKKNFISNNILF